jgi:hypothetical protein
MEGDLKRNETVSPMAGKTPSQEMLVDVTRLEREYFERLPDVEDPTQLVSFGTSGHRGSSLRGSFNEAHILAITQAICDYRRIDAADASNEKYRDHFRAWLSVRLGLYEFFAHARSLAVFHISTLASNRTIARA